MKTQMQLKENKQINADQQSFLREIAKYMKFYSKRYKLNINKELSNINKFKNIFRKVNSRILQVVMDH